MKIRHDPRNAQSISGGVGMTLTIEISPDEVKWPSRDVIAEIVSSCFYHAETLGVRSIAFPLLGTGTGGFSREVCLDTIFRCLARTLFHGATCVDDARIVVWG